MSEGVSDPRPYRGVLKDIRTRVRGAWLPDPIAAGWEHGTDVAYVRELRHYWLERYDWARAEARLNEHPQFVTSVDGLDVHFYWERASRTAAPAIILTHGWPGSVIEFLHVIDRIAHPERFGGAAAEGFDVVVPSLPGFAFSGKPASPMGPQATARTWRRLMRDVLGYRWFFAQGGDLGSMVTATRGTRPFLVFATWTFRSKQRLPAPRPRARGDDGRRRR
jgi:microsomal epoxide hydrolase